ncbi:hypothetical protein GALMADRAFT_57764 [Galerina marginata CBS 339.88]|uniref:Uncharacterized protein n=1 Tax=Galerina marginata (strain CBS 339.88) TaxID=685588 RepID=A0A067TJ60_GALM3|nr:hypothetical protein GALMADRAFT_57764 [Galerina marginata CBS 339.88]
MKTTSFATAILLAAVGIVQADNCNAGLNYCGHSLISKGQLDQLYRDVLGITVSSANGDVWNGDLFACNGGRSGVVTRIQACPSGVCTDNGNGKSDTCA